MKKPIYPSLYQVNTRVWLTDLSVDLGRPATLDDIPDPELDRLAEMGFDFIWFLSVWTTGENGRKVSLEMLPPASFSGPYRQPVAICRHDE
jgi:hypothetical protein